MKAFILAGAAAAALLAVATAQAQSRPPPGSGAGPGPGGGGAAQGNWGRPPGAWGARPPPNGGWGSWDGGRHGWQRGSRGYWGPRAGIAVTFGAPVVWGGAWGGTWWGPWGPGWGSPWVGAWGSPWAGAWGSPWVGTAWPAVVSAPVVVAQPPQTIVIQQPSVPASEPAPSFWYYCTQPPGYFPYVQACEKPWMKAVPQAPGESSSPPRVAP